MMEWGETFIFHVVSQEFQLEQPKPSVICQHGADRRVCDAKVKKRTLNRKSCISSEPHFFTHFHPYCCHVLFQT